ncbi:MFS transporter [Shimazuella alba]|uniref:MFS transporter n=1 Tax=Shimazuella alba TaxID=2690964 RepID=A0A6I4VVG1_9BACL|nr:MFS transporter [Shimazuella alba]MXQ53826.1 MFS transporter [Shimazuella alba]
MKNRMLVYILALAVFLIGTIEYIITGIIQMVSSDLHVSTSSTGLLVTTFALSSAIGAPIIIALTINVDRKKLLLSMLLVFIASTFLSFSSFSYEMMLFTRVLQGVSGGIVTVVAMAVATRLVEKDKRGNAIGIILMGLSSSLVLGVPIGTFLSSIIGWRGLFIAAGVLTLIPFIFVFKNVPSIKEKESITIGKQLSVLKNKKVVITVIITLFYISGYSTLFTYLTPFLQGQSNLVIAEISGVLLLAGISSFLGSRVGGLTVDKKGPKFTIFIGLLLQAIMLLLLSLIGGLLSLVGFIAVIMIWMLATWGTSPAQQLYLVTQVPRSPDIGISVNTSFIQFGFALGSALGGYVINISSVLNLGWMGLGFVILALLMATILFAFERASKDLANSNTK